MSLPIPNRRVLSWLCLSASLAACGPVAEGDDVADVPGGFPGYTPGFTVIADGGDQVKDPQDLDFHPNADRALLRCVSTWTLSAGTSGAMVTSIASSQGEGDRASRRPSRGRVRHQLR